MRSRERSKPRLSDQRSRHLRPPARRSEPGLQQPRPPAGSGASWGAVPRGNPRRRRGDGHWRGIRTPRRCSGPTHAPSKAKAPRSAGSTAARMPAWLGTRTPHAVRSFLPRPESLTTPRTEPPGVWENQRPEGRYQAPHKNRNISLRKKCFSE